MGEHCSRVEGGGYVDPAGGPLVAAHGAVMVRVAGMKRAARPGNGRALQWGEEIEVASAANLRETPGN